MYIAYGYLIIYNLTLPNQRGGRVCMKSYAYSELLKMSCTVIRHWVDITLYTLSSFVKPVLYMCKNSDIKLVTSCNATQVALFETFCYYTNITMVLQATRTVSWDIIMPGSMRNVSASRILICKPQLTQKSAWRLSRKQNIILKSILK